MTFGSILSRRGLAANAVMVMIDADQPVMMVVERSGVGGAGRSDDAERNESDNQGLHGEASSGLVPYDRDARCGIGHEPSLNRRRLAWIEAGQPKLNLGLMNTADILAPLKDLTPGQDCGLRVMGDGRQTRWRNGASRPVGRVERAVTRGLSIRPLRGQARIGALGSSLRPQT